MKEKEYRELVMLAEREYARAIEAVDHVWKLANGGRPPIKIKWKARG